MKQVLAIGLMCLLMTGCVPMWTGNAMQEDIDALKQQQATINQDMGAKQAELSAMVDSARADVTELKGVLQSATDLLKRNNADFGLEIESLRQEVQRLRGQLEESDFRLQKMQQDLQLFKEDVDIRFSDGGGTAMPESAKDLFRFAADKFEAKDYRLARKGFEAFIAKYPRDKLVADAIFYNGETYFAQAQWVSAALEYQKVMQNHERSDRAGDAAFRTGDAFAKMGRCKEAKLFYETVVKDYAKSKFSGQARDRLKTIKDDSCQ